MDLERGWDIGHHISKHESHDIHLYFTKLHEWGEYLQRWFLGLKGMRSMRTLRQKRRSRTKLGSKNCVTIFGAEFGSAASECGPIRKKLWRQPSSFKQYFQTKLCTKKMLQNRLRFRRDVLWLFSLKQNMEVVFIRSLFSHLQLPKCNTIGI